MLAQRVVILIMGAYAAGKSTFLSSLAKIKSLDPAIRFIKDGSQGQQGYVGIQTEDLYVDCFNVPGQKRFDFMWEILSEGATGLILIVDSTRPETFFEAQLILKTFQGYAPLPFVIAANRHNEPGAFNVHQLRELLKIDPAIKVIPCQVTQPETVSQTMLQLLHAILEKLEAEEKRRQSSKSESALPQWLCDMSPTLEKTKAEEKRQKSSENESELSEWLSGSPSIGEKNDRVSENDNSPSDVSTPPVLEEKPVGPATLQKIEFVEKLKISRTLPIESIAIASFLNAVQKQQFNRQSVFGSFSRYAYVIAKMKGQIIGLAKFYVENFITYVTLVLSPEVIPVNTVGKALLDAVAACVKPLQAEVILCDEFAGLEKVFEVSGYKLVRLANMTELVWREAYCAKDRDIMALRLKDKSARQPF